MEKKKKMLTPNIQIGNGGMDIEGIRAIAQSDPENFVKRVQDLIDKKEISWSKVRSIQRMFGVLADVQVPTTVEIMPGVTRAIQASAFPILAGGLTVAGINEAYEAVPTIGQELVTERDDNKKISVIAAINSLNPSVDGVAEGQDYPEIGASQEVYTIANKRDGRRLSITAEMIEENDVAGIVDRVNALGEIAAETVEEQTLRRVCDIDGSGTSPAEPYVLHLNTTGTQLYNSTANNPGKRAPSGTRVTNNELTDETDLDAVRTVLAAMVNSRGKRIAIPVNQCQLLVPDALSGVAMKILNSEYVSGIENELSNWGPRGAYRPRLLSSPKLDAISTTAATTWYLGQFPKQFKRKWKLNFEYVTLSGDTEKFLTSRIAFQARLGWDVEIGAVDYVYCVQSLKGTTAP